MDGTDKVLARATQPVGGNARTDTGPGLWGFA